MWVCKSSAAAVERRRRSVHTDNLYSECECVQAAYLFTLYKCMHFTVHGCVHVACTSSLKVNNWN